MVALPSSLEERLKRVTIKNPYIIAIVRRHTGASPQILRITRITSGVNSNDPRYHGFGSGVYLDCRVSD